MARYVGLDFETYCELNLKEVGLMRYVNHPTFEIPLASIVDENGAETTLEFPRRAPRTLVTVLGIHDRGTTICAHNAGFELAVLEKMGINNVPIIDSAVVAALAGGDRNLASAALQLLNMDKLDEDGNLKKLFAMPQKGQGSTYFDHSLLATHPQEWQQYKEYGLRDALLARLLVLTFESSLPNFTREMEYATLTQAMNRAGWKVDINAVVEMRRRYQVNLETIRRGFATNVDPDLNLNSHIQLKKWCADRGIKATSFDKLHVEQMIQRLEKRGSTQGLNSGQFEVLTMLKTKQELGGASLKKLETILKTQYDGRVYDQYVHAGAPQSLRTSGRSIQMQNLPRLTHVQNMADLFEPGSHWSNEELAGNLRQVFTATDPKGSLIVGDFASIESRMLAHVAGETWKEQAYAQGKDVYKAQAVKIYNLPFIEAVTKEQRTTGKVGELSCGYGAGPVAVKDFAEKMGVQFTEQEAGALVTDWRTANPKTVDLWERLGQALLDTVTYGRPNSVFAEHGLTIKFGLADTPHSLIDQASNVQSIRMRVWKGGEQIATRIFHGCHLVGSDIRYYKPNSNKGGKPWKSQYTDPKTKRRVHYKLYGGKLTGILIQSLCREIFFEVLQKLHTQLETVPNAQIVGQFHDEIIVDWQPGPFSKEHVMSLMQTTMSGSPTHPTLPMAAEIKDDYRYTK